MIKISDLHELSDRFREATALDRESTLSHRIFGDNKVLGNLRTGGEITVGRFNRAFSWFDQNWPTEAPIPPILARYRAEQAQSATAPPESGEPAKDAA